MHLKIVDLQSGTKKSKRPCLKLSPKVKSLLSDSLLAICSALFFALNLDSAMHEWTQHQSEWRCFVSVGAASYCLSIFSSSLWSGLSHLDQ